MSNDRKSQIWVDADACPVTIKEIIFRAAQRTKTLTTLIANHSMRVPKSAYLQFYQVQAGFDIADNEIVQRAQSGDIVITQDIPLADEVISKGCLALSPRGELFTKENIRSRLNIRDFMDTMRSSGVELGGGPPPLNQQDKQNFANQLDKWLAQQA